VLLRLGGGKALTVEHKMRDAEFIHGEHQVVVQGPFVDASHQAHALRAQHQCLHNRFREIMEHFVVHGASTAESVKKNVRGKLFRAKDALHEVLNKQAVV